MIIDFVEIICVLLNIDCPPEILLGLHFDASQFAELIKLEAAITLFREGKFSSGMAARWLNMPMALIQRIA